jgi:dipeptidase
MNFRKLARISLFVCTVSLIYILSSVFFTAFSQNCPEESFNCFSILVGKDASLDGSILFAHNEDDYGTQIVYLYKVPHRTHKFEEVVSREPGLNIAQIPETNEYLWIEMPGMQSSDCFMNEYGVTIGSDACQSREDKPVLTGSGIGYTLRILMAERAKTSKEAVKIAGFLIEELGYKDSGRTYCIADANEAWMLSVVNGKHWVARRIPDDKVAVIPNYYTITDVNLSDTMNYLGSKDLISYATDRGWYDPQKDGKFSFRKAYAPKSSLENMVNIIRMWRGINALSLTKYVIEDDFPFTFLPDKKVGLTDLMSILRDHNEGTEYDPSQDYTKGSPHLLSSSTICAVHTQYGFIAQLRNYMPATIGCVLWIAPFRPCVHPFIPWYNGINDTPEEYRQGDYITAINNHFNAPDDLYVRNDSLAYWNFVNHMEAVDKNYGALIKKEKKQREFLEKPYRRNQSAFEQKLIVGYQENPPELRKKLTEYTTKAAHKMFYEYRKKATK